MRRRAARAWRAPMVSAVRHVEIHALERDAEQLADVRLVVDDERARFRH